MAKMETASATSDNLYYFNIETTRADKPANYPVDNAYSTPNDKVAKVSGSGNKIGPAMILKVMAGDKFNLQVNSWYRTYGATPNTPVDPLSDIVSAVTNSVPLIAGGKIVQSQLTSTLLNPSVTGFITDRDGNNYNTVKPKAYINWILFDEQMNPVITSDGKNSGAEQVAGNNVYKTHTISQREITKNGYLYIYVSNETPNIDVYFDQLQVTHIRGPLVSESAYYPFGLEAKAICSQAAITTTNAFKFNAGTELNDKFDISYYETYFRNYDMQVGRFTGVDILSELYLNSSPYVFAANDPIFWNDPTGLALSMPAEEEPESDPFGGMSMWAWIGFNTGHYDNNESGGMDEAGWGINSDFSGDGGGASSSLLHINVSNKFSSYNIVLTAKPDNLNPCPPGYSRTQKKGGDTRPYFFNPNDAAIYWAFKNRSLGMPGGPTSKATEFSSEIRSFNVKNNGGQSSTTLYFATEPVKFLGGDGGDPVKASPGMGHAYHGVLPSGYTRAGLIHLHWQGSESLSAGLLYGNEGFSVADRKNLANYNLDKYMYVLGSKGTLWVRYPEDMTLPDGYPDPDQGEIRKVTGGDGFYGAKVETPELCKCYKQ
jgi:RHS repeat-associated protein